MSFQEAFTKLIQVEGGYVDDPLDLGGKTKYGISQKAYPEIDIPSLTLEDAAKIYKRDYWDSLSLDEFPEIIAHEAFDSAVNCGVGRAARWIQEGLNLLGKSLKVDGKIGPVTVEAVKSYRHPDVLLKVLNGLQFAHYYKIVQYRPEQGRFFRGWMRRVWESRED